MELNTNKFKITTNQQGEISSIKFYGQEILHDGKKWWQKIFPIIWPVIGISKGFEVEGKNYKIPKHGFWKELDWDGYVIKNKITLMSTFIKNENFPWSIDINNRIKIVNNNIIIETTFSNISRRDSYFHFGYHPAFKIDKNTIINGPNPIAIDLAGKITQKVIRHEKLVKMNFGEEYDTLVNKNINPKNVSFKANGLKINCNFNSPNLQIWKPKDAEFICVEPWWGTCDLEKESIVVAKNKEGIIKLEPGKQFIAKMTINVTKI